MVELTAIDESFLPRGPYRPGGRVSKDLEVFNERVPRWPDENTKITEHYRHVNREMIASAWERTLVSAIIPPGATHICTAFAIAFPDPIQLVDFHSATLSICLDFLVKFTGRQHCSHSVVGMLPMLDGPFLEACRLRGLRLNCLSSIYADLCSG